MTNNEYKSISFFGLRINCSRKVAASFFVVAISLFCALSTIYLFYPSFSVNPRCSPDGHEGRYYEYDHPMNERFALAYASYLLYEVIQVRYDNKTSKVFIAPARRYVAPLVHASIYAAEIVLYGMKPGTSLDQLKENREPSVTCDQVRQLSAK